MNVTFELARFVAESRLEDRNETAQDEAIRALIDWLGCALAGCLDPALDTAMEALSAGFGPQQATLIGRGDRIDILNAALLGTLGADILGYADTLAAADIEPVVCTAGALLALAESRAASGAAFVHGLMLGGEIACRAALALGAGHSLRGWDASATCGVLGAAAACARLLELDIERTAAAIGIAATQASGLDAMSGTPSRSLARGFAARNGLTAALLAQAGFTASAQALEAPRGFLQVLGAGPHAEALLSALSTQWELTGIARKPYPCDIGMHPVIEACLQIKHRHKPSPRSIAGIDLRVHPKAMRAGMAREPSTGLEARRSLHHCAAAALLDGALGLQQFQDRRVANARLGELRSRVEAIADETLGEHEARVSIRLQDGRALEQRVRCALGSPLRPMSDADVAVKFRSLASEALATDQTERLLALAWNIRALTDVGALVRASVPEDELELAELPGSPLIPR